PVVGRGPQYVAVRRDHQPVRSVLRGVVMSWGTNRAGVTWLIDPSDEDDFEVSLARGRVRPTAGEFRMAYLPYALPFADLTVNVQVDQVATGERINAIMAVRSRSEERRVGKRQEVRGGRVIMKQGQF